MAIAAFERFEDEGRRGPGHGPGSGLVRGHGVGPVGLPGRPPGGSGRPALHVVGAPRADEESLADITPIGACRGARSRPVLRHGEEVSRRRALRRSAQVRRRRVALAVLTVGLLTALALPVSVLGGSSPDNAATALPTAADGGSGVVYVVQPGDTLASVAARVAPGHAARMENLLARETGSRTLVPGQHVLLP